MSHHAITNSKKLRVLASSTGARYLITGGCLFLLDLPVFLALKHFFEFPSPLAQLISRTTGAVAGFVAHKLFSFRNLLTGPSVIAAQSAVYTANTVFTVLFSPLVVAFIQGLVPGNLVLVKVLAEFVMIGETYLVLRFIFRKSASDDTARINLDTLWSSTLARLQQPKRMDCRLTNAT